MTLDGEHVASGNIAGMATRILRRAGGVILGCFGRGQTGIMLWHSCAGASAALWQRREHRQPRSERVSGPRLSRSSAVLQQTRRPNRSRPPSMKLIGNWRLCVRRPVYHAVVRPLFSAKRTTGVDVNRTFPIAAGAIPAIRDRDVLPSQLRSRLNVADKSQRRRDLGKLGRRRKAFERGPDCGLRVGVASS